MKEIASVAGPRSWIFAYLHGRSGLEETREELEEFQSGSRELEAELEAQLEQAEGRCSEYKSQMNRLALENESLKETILRAILSSDPVLGLALSCAGLLPCAISPSNLLPRVPAYHLLDRACQGKRVQ
ncbi:hypothetical protein SK128_000271 [Halocaridina rubra]|uniref:Uncharacterized protein n=1 Tax=Halocaridina rubra TaxID=373956 RepID=A0AAN9A4N8_HALRR